MSTETQPQKRWSTGLIFGATGRTSNAALEGFEGQVWPDNRPKPDPEISGQTTFRGGTKVFVLQISGSLCAMPEQGPLSLTYVQLLNSMCKARGSLRTDVRKAFITDLLVTMKG